MLVARYRAAEQELIVALGENRGIGDEQAQPIVRTLIELTCAFCGFETWAGIYSREHPDRVPYPKTISPDEDDKRSASRRRRSSRA
jgi:hypothetical protein